MKKISVVLIVALLVSLVALPMRTEAKTISEFEAEVRKYTQDLENVKSKIVTNEAEVAKIKANIASIEKVHSERFKKYADKLEKGLLFKDTTKELWMCTNCGFIYEGEEAPLKCPVCLHLQGFFIEFSESPFED